MSIPNIRQNRLKRHFFATNRPQNHPNSPLSSNIPSPAPFFGSKRHRKTRPIRIGFFVAEKQGFVFQRSEKTMFWERSVQLAVTGFGNKVAPCIARKSLKTTSKNPTYSDRVFCGGQVVIAFELFSLLLSYRLWSIFQYLCHREC